MVMTRKHWVEATQTDIEQQAGGFNVFLGEIFESKDVLSLRDEPLRNLDDALLDLEKTQGSLVRLNKVVECFEAWQNSSPENQGEKPRTIRNRQLAVTRLFKQLVEAKFQTQARTSAFINDPKAFLKHTLFDCGKSFDVSVIGAGINDQQLLRNYEVLLQFILVPASANAVTLNLAVSPSVSNRPTWAGAPIMARFLGFAYNVNGPGQMGFIDVDDGPPCDMIFTVGLSGCSIVAVKHDNGHLCFYHEPTRDDNPHQWDNQYPGRVLLKVAPRGATDGRGSAVIYKKANRWRVAIQSFNFDQDAWIQAVQEDAAVKNSGGFRSGNDVSFSQVQRVDFEEVPWPTENQ